MSEPVKGTVTYVLAPPDSHIKQGWYVHPLDTSFPMARIYGVTMGPFKDETAARDVAESARWIKGSYGVPDDD